MALSASRYRGVILLALSPFLARSFADAFPVIRRQLSRSLVFSPAAISPVRLWSERACILSLSLSRVIFLPFARRLVR